MLPPTPRRSPNLRNSLPRHLAEQTFVLALGVDEPFKVSVGFARKRVSKIPSPAVSTRHRDIGRRRHLALDPLGGDRHVENALLLHDSLDLGNAVVGPLLAAQLVEAGILLARDRVE